MEIVNYEDNNNNDNNNNSNYYHINKNKNINNNSSSNSICSSSSNSKNKKISKYQNKNMETRKNHKQNFMIRIQDWWNDQIMEFFSKANLFIVCCIAAGLLLIAYLAAFSCEVSWLLESRGDLPSASYLLCSGYFIMFVASTILIHGLVTGLPWGLFSWSIVIGLLSIPELAFVMIMTTQHWGLQSTHGLTELISYLIRLVINCLALLCVIPTALKWRRETQVLTQLQMLATRLQHQTPPPSVPMSKCESRRSSSSRKQQRRHSHNYNSNKTSNAFDNPGFLVNENDITTGIIHPYHQNHHYHHSTSSHNPTNRYESHNEFNASVFGLNPAQYIESYVKQSPPLNVKKSQSLMDLRYAYSSNGGILTSPSTDDQVDNIKMKKQLENNYYEQIKNINEKNKNIEDLSTIGGSSINDPIYCTIQDNKSPKLSRNCISLENLEGIAKIKNDLSYGNNLLQNHHYWYMLGYPTLIQQQYHQPHNYFHHRLHQQQQQQQLQQQQHHHHHHHLQQQQQQQHYHNHHLQQYTPLPSHPMHYYNYPIPMPIIGSGGIGYGGYTNPYANKSNTNSKQSIGTDNSDDYRKYRDVAL